MGDFSFLILIALVSIGIGFALGSLVTGARGERKPTEKPKPQTVPSLIQIAGIMTDRGGKVAYLLVDGKVLRSTRDLTKDQRTRLTPYMEVLFSWFHETLSNPQAAPTVGLAQAENAQANILVSAPSEVQRPSIKPVNILTRAMLPELPPEPPKSIVAQIDDILQEKLENSPLSKRGIRLRELPNQGMAVMVGLDQYEGVDDVPDEEIRSMIRSAVSEWEKRIST
ncbi:MAG: hypothetical protein A2W33_09785 [Chloroflexi bacterium RBG_16_52_11]|nr:MAG: hypothetical protein A2W33_09785 [Chloroflexi bacterium RBG_16_52_11]